MTNPLKEPPHNHTKIDVKKVDKDTYQEKDRVTGDVINYKRTVQKFRLWLSEVDIMRTFAVSHVDVDGEVNECIEKFPHKNLSLRGEVKGQLDNLFVIERDSWSKDSWSKENLYYDLLDPQPQETIILEGYKYNVLHGGFSDKSSLRCRIPSDFLEEIAVNLANHPDSSINISLVITGFESAEREILLVEEYGGDIYIEEIELIKKIGTPKNTEDKSNKLDDFKAEERNQSSLVTGNNLNMKNVLWFIGGMLLANLFPT